jgi:hypothetical protein
MLAHQPPCVSLIEAADPQALADALRNLAAQARPTQACHGVLRSSLDAEAIGQQCVTLLKNHLGLES